MSSVRRDLSSAEKKFCGQAVTLTRVDCCCFSGGYAGEGGLLPEREGGQERPRLLHPGHKEEHQAQRQGRCGHRRIKGHKHVLYTSYKYILLKEFDMTKKTIYLHKVLFFW